MPTCPLCQKQADLLIANGKDYFILQGKSADFEINYCAGCQTAFSLPVLTDQELEPYYPENYEAYVGKKRFLGWLQTLKYKADLKFIKKIIKKDQASIFEIGAGRGEFLAAAVKFGFKVNGLEPSQAGRDFAQKNYKLRLQPGFASDLVFEQKYDLVIARHVFEHLNNPWQVLKKIIDNGLTPGGYL
ncbi:MAG: class I SAM-dependent methyltransferase, partial [Patescibacteria group bacterium]